MRWRWERCAEWLELPGLAATPPCRQFASFVALTAWCLPITLQRHQARSPHTGCDLASGPQGCAALAPCYQSNVRHKAKEKGGPDRSKRIHLFINWCSGQLCLSQKVLFSQLSSLFLFLVQLSSRAIQLLSSRECLASALKRSGSAMSRSRR